MQKGWTVSSWKDAAIEGCLMANSDVPHARQLPAGSGVRRSAGIHPAELESLRRDKEMSDKIIDTVREPMLVLNSELRVLRANKAFFRKFQTSAAEAEGVLVYDLGNGEWNVPGLRRLLEDVLPDNHVFDDYRVEHTFKHIGPRVMLLNARRVNNNQFILLAFEDITERTQAEQALIATEEQLFLAMRASRMYAWTWDLQGGHLPSEDGFEMIGLPAHAWESWRTLHAEDVGALRDRLSEAIAHRRELATDCRFIRADSSDVIWAHLRGRIDYDATGRPIRIVGTAIDITDRKRSESALRESETRLRQTSKLLERQVAERTQLLSLLQELTRVANEAHTVDDALREALLRIARYSQWELGHVWRLAETDGNRMVSAGIWYVADQLDIDPDQLRAFQLALEQASYGPDEGMVGGVMSSGKPRRADALSSRPSILAPKSGLPISLHDSIAYPVFEGTQVVAVLQLFSRRPVSVEERLLAIMPDVGVQLGHVFERKRLERQVADATEREQRRIGSDIHDGVGQELTGLRYLAQTHAESLARQGLPDAELARRITHGLDAIQKQFRAVVQSLIPVELDERGLGSALQLLAERTSRTHNIECAFRVNRPITLHDNLVATHLYRIVQEAVNNAVRHAHASIIEIHLEEDDEGLHLRVVDDGIGIQVTPRHDDGVGLRSMNFRADVVGARLSVTRRGERGTVVLCMIPRRSRGEKGPR